VRLVDFIKHKIACQTKEAKELISQDFTNNTTTYKYTYLVELIPLCKEDLVWIPKTLSRLLGGMGPLCVVYKVSTAVHIVDVLTMKTTEIDQATYWKHKFGQLCSKDKLTEFVIINIIDEEYDINTSMSRAAMKEKFHMVEVEVARKEDFGKNNDTFIVKTHLGNHLKYNDSVLAYDLNSLAMQEIDNVKAEYKGQYPDLVIVKKYYPKYRKRQQSRYWKLQHMPKEDENEEMKEFAGDGEQKTKKQKRFKRD